MSTPAAAAAAVEAAIAAHAAWLIASRDGTVSPAGLARLYEATSRTNDALGLAVIAEAQRRANRRKAG